MSEPRVFRERLARTSGRLSSTYYFRWVTPAGKRRTISCKTGNKRAAEKIRGMRIFNDGEGKMNLSCEAIEGEFLVVSQFTLCADLRRGKRPGFDPAMKPPEAERLYERFCTELAERTGRPVKKGEFGAEMRVELVNEGPVTFVLTNDQ